MPLKWTLHPELRRVEATATGRLCQRDVARYFTHVTKAGAGAYSALFDISAAEVELSAADLTHFGRQAQIHGGAIAIVVLSEAEHELADHFARRAGGGRACRLFDDAPRARAWLDGQVAP